MLLDRFKITCLDKLFNADTQGMYIERKLSCYESIDGMFRFVINSHNNHVQTFWNFGIDNLPMWLKSYITDEIRIIRLSCSCYHIDLNQKNNLRFHMHCDNGWIMQSQSWRPGRRTTWWPCVQTMSGGHVICCVWWTQPRRLVLICEGYDIFNNFDSCMHIYYIYHNYR